MRNVVQLRRVGQVSGAAGYDGSSESSSSSESMSDSNFENENVVKSTESSHVTVSSKFEEAGVLEEIEEESVHLEGINFSKAWKPFRKHHPTHSTSSTVMAMSYGRQWRSVHPMWRSLNHHRRKSSRSHEKACLESIGQSFDPHYEYHYSPMPMVSSPANPEAEIEARKVDMDVQQETEREVQMMEGTQKGMTRTSGALGGQVEKGGDHHTWACTRIRSQPDLNAYLICSSCEAHGHFVADFPMTSVIRAVPISVILPASPA
ncbi:hypothetical protein HID58_024982 [Brassica napus]|uniref:Uncharacterized protein n=2 Tax=Brassica TaxID=3705 RepID=A0ABQ8CJR2_BRANA|nr:hypothetical protein HID58_024982 [Brassica napus]